MHLDDPSVSATLGRCRVARIATASRSGRPNINPLYFVVDDGRIWLGTSDWTLAARNVVADPRVSVLFEVEGHPGTGQVVRVVGRATVRRDAPTLRTYDRRVARRYLLTPGGIRNTLAHLRQARLIRNYHAQGAEKGEACVIEVVPDLVEVI